MCFRTDTVFCFNFSTHDKETLTAETNKEVAYIRKGLKSWKKHPKRFEEHQQSNCDKISTVYHVVVPKCKDIAELTRENLSAERAKERRYLLDVIRGLRYLDGKGIALHVHKGGQFYATDGSSWSEGRKHTSSSLSVTWK